MELSTSVYEEVRDRLRARFGGSADLWWRTLPSVLAQLSDRWALTIDTPVGTGNTSLVLRCCRVGGYAEAHSGAYPRCGRECGAQRLGVVGPGAGGLGL